MDQAKMFDKWDDVLKDLNKEIEAAMKESLATGWISRPFYKQAMTKLRNLLKDAKPVYVCTECNGGEQSCETCRGLGVLSKVQYGLVNGKDVA